MTRATVLAQSTTAAGKAARGSNPLIPTNLFAILLRTIFTKKKRGKAALIFKFFMLLLILDHTSLLHHQPNIDRHGQNRKCDGMSE
jgi:hypothetical protein